MTCPTCARQVGQPRYGPRKMYCQRSCWPSRRRFCSDRCAFVYHRQADHDRRRAIRLGATADLIYRRRIFERDGWECALCRGPVDPSLPGTDDYGATLDHIIPLARGGQHVESNVQLAHWICNRRKGAGARAA